VPQPGENVQRGEGVALVLSGPAIAAWKTGSDQLRTWGSRIVRAKLSTGKRFSGQLHVLSCYAPTYAASREAKEEFYDNLQSALDEIPAEDMYVILGDFNARVGSRGADDDQWWKVRGPCGLGVVNEAGAELLNFLLLNGTTICNTWFQKRNIHKQTWQHPKTKNWHCIDYVMMREKDRRRCVDVEVKRRAECHTDHQLLRAKLLMARQWFRKGKKMTSKQYAVPLLSDARTGEEMKQLFASTAAAMVKSKWNEDDPAEEKWQRVKNALTATAESTLGYEKRRNPDWFNENADVLEPLLQMRNQMYSR